MGVQRKDKQIFEGGICNKRGAVLFLAIDFIEDDKARIVESMFCKIYGGIASAKEKSDLSRWENNSFYGKNGQLRKTTTHNQCANK